MLFEGEKNSILTAKKCRGMLSISEENTYGQSHSAAWFPKNGRPISAPPAHFKSVIPTYSEKVLRRDIRRIKLLKALWKSVAGKEVQIIPLGEKMGRKMPLALWRYCQSTQEHGERCSICRGCQTFIGYSTSLVLPLRALILKIALFSGFAIL